jgi:Na+-translocating ferredoxin:NAD+ oxidoreductase RnfC subunit
LQKIEVSSNEVVVHKGTKASGTLFVPFPNHLLEDEHAKNAILCDKSSPLAPMALMQLLVAQIFHSKQFLVLNT